jgi:hypothetical protein
MQMSLATQDSVPVYVVWVSPSNGSDQAIGITLGMTTGYQPLPEGLGGVEGLDTLVQGFARDLQALLGYDHLTVRRSDVTQTDITPS